MSWKVVSAVVLIELVGTGCTRQEDGKDAAGGISQPVSAALPPASGGVPSAIIPKTEMLLPKVEHPRRTADEVMLPALVESASSFDPNNKCFTLKRQQPCDATGLATLGDGGSVTVRRVLEHTFVGSEWMAYRMEQVLRAWPDELLQLFRCSRGVLIGSTISYSHVYLGENIVYLAPDWLAVSEEEGQAIADTNAGNPDPRSYAFDTAPYRIKRTYETTDRTPALDPTLSAQERSMVLRASATLVHELSHACDGLARATASGAPTLSSSLTPLDKNGVYFYDQLYYKSQQAYRSRVAALPLTDFAAILQSDTSVDSYDYVDQYEHFAMLIETVMMHHVFGLTMTQLITSPFRTDASSQDIVVEEEIRDKVCYGASWREALKAVSLSGLAFPALGAAADCQMSAAAGPILLSDVKASLAGRLLSLSSAPPLLLEMNKPY